MSSKPAAMRIRKLTDIQRETLEAIRDHINQFGEAPSRKELCQALGLTYQSTVDARLQALERKHFIELVRSKARGIRLLREDTPIHELSEIPMVQAGAPQVAEDGNLRPQMRTVDKLWTRFEQTPDYFVVVEGDSMDQIGIGSGDIVAVRCDPEPRDGDIVIARIDDAITLKRYHRINAECIELQPQSTNPEHRPLRIGPDTDFGIAGIVVGAIIGTRREGPGR